MRWWFAALVAVPVVGMAAVLTTQPTHPLPHPPAHLPVQAAAQPDQSPQPTPDAVPFTRGGAVYQTTCAACHGTTGGGGTGDDVTAGPPLRGLPLAYVDLTLQTGRMPITHLPAGVAADRLDDADREALIDWARAQLALTGDIPRVGPGDAAAGRVLYVRHCAACHGATGTGGIAGGETRVPPVVGFDAVAIVEAIRVGPFEMPAFSPQVIDDQEANDIAAYVLEELDDPASTPLGLTEVGSAAALIFTILFAGLLFAALLVVARLGRVPGKGQR